MLRNTTRAAGAALLLASMVLAPALAVPEARATVDIQVLNVSDWHAQLDPVRGAGGAAVLAAYWAADRAANPNTLTLTSGDAFGASPPLSGFFEEEPGVKAMNLMGFSADALGNHNFDRGLAHLQRMIDLAAFPLLSANLANLEGNLRGVEPYRVFDVAGVQVAVIGLTNPEAPDLVLPGNFGTIEVTDPVAAAREARDDAAAEGATVFVLLPHMGVTHRDEQGAWRGPLIDLAEQLTGFDLILGDHTDAEFAQVVNGALVTENRSKGSTYLRITLTVDAATGEVVARAHRFVRPATSGVTPDEAIEAMLLPYRLELAKIFDRKIGEATDVFERRDNAERLREVPLGNLVSDATRERYGTQLALHNGGGLRAALPSSYLPLNHSLRRPEPGYAQGPPWDLVVGDVYTALPFGNSVVTRNVTGEQLHKVLENAVSQLPAANGRFAQVSGFTFAYDTAKPPGERVVAAWWHPDAPPAQAAAPWGQARDALAADPLGLALPGRVDPYLDVVVPCPRDLAPPQVCAKDVPIKGRAGIPILRDQTNYTLATNNFVNAGGDFYAMLADGQGVTREVLADVVLRHIEALGTLSPRTEDRIIDARAALGLPALVPGASPPGVPPLPTTPPLGVRGPSLGDVPPVPALPLPQAPFPAEAGGAWPAHPRGHQHEH